MAHPPTAGPVDPTARIDYGADLIPDDDTAGAPLPTLYRWYEAASSDDRVVEPGAMVVATVDADGAPNARTVLLKGLDARGLVFFTNTGSTKGRELATDARASVVLLWHAMYRQVRARGVVEQVSREEALEYFTSRPRGSQVAAWASAQSHPLATRQELLDAVAAVEQRFAGQDELPLPDFWGGYRVRPVEVELWAGQRNRLHDRWVWATADGSPAPLDDADAWQGGRRQP
jgi:pyridoxamine 5'-phosphate oxidase